MKFFSTCVTLVMVPITQLLFQYVQMNVRRRTFIMSTNLLVVIQVSWAVNQVSFELFLIFLVLMSFQVKIIGKLKCQGSIELLLMPRVSNVYQARANCGLPQGAGF